MGYCLFYEAMFDSVIFARDNFLKSDGIMIPNVARFYIAAAHYQEQ
jgi:protein arginine N-methyltransferase 3